MGTITAAKGEIMNNQIARYTLASINWEYIGDGTLCAVYNAEKAGKGCSVPVVKGWVQGLPSALDIDFQNYDILSRFGMLDANDDDQFDFVELYWNTVATTVYKLINSGF